MIISIASGKGGTGKTTVATNLAFSIETDVQIMTVWFVSTSLISTLI